MSVPSTTTEPNVHRMMIITTDEDIIHQIQTNYNSPSVKSVILNPRKKRNTSSTNDKQSEKRSLTCVVCGAPAHGWNFGVITCESCKLFFRRNGLKDPTALSCRINNQCEVKIETRRRCLPCRLRKCLESGMKRDRLLKAEEKIAKSPKTHNEIDNSIEPEVPSCLLTADDFERIEYIRQSFDKRIELAAQDGFENNLLTVAQDISDQINTHSVAALRLLAFFKQIPEFNEININDKMILIKYNLMHVIAFNYAVSFRPQADKLHRIDEDVPWNVELLKTVHGQSTLADLSRIFRPLILMTNRDMKLFSILFIVFILFKGISTGEGVAEPILEDEMNVHRAQNIFTELLWKYLETTYDFDTATRIMLSIVTRCISWQVYYLKMRCNIDRLISVTNETKVLPLMKSIFHV